MSRVQHIVLLSVDRDLPRPCPHLEDAPGPPFCDEMRPRPRPLVEPRQAKEHVHLLQAIGTDILDDARVFRSGEECTRDYRPRFVCVPANAEQ